MTAYKLLRKRKNGTLGPLFINCRQVIEPGRQYQAESSTRAKGTPRARDGTARYGR